MAIRVLQLVDVCDLMNEKGYRARLGQTGKFYCGQTERNTTCGPSTGYNCVACMKLDLKMRKLPSGWLVNRVGASVQLSARGKFHCGRRTDKKDMLDPYCDPRHGGQCDDCSHFTGMHAAYKPLL